MVVRLSARSAGLVAAAVIAAVVIASPGASGAKPATKPLRLSVKPSCAAGKVVLEVTALSGRAVVKGVALRGQMLAFRNPPISRATTGARGKAKVTITVPGGLSDSDYGVGVSGSKTGYRLTDTNPFSGRGRAYNLHVSGGGTRCGFRSLR